MLKKLPFPYEFDDIEILKQLVRSKSALGELNGILEVLPNPDIILNAVTLGEAKDSSEIENIVTTYDAIFKELSLASTTTASKEVVRYRQGMLHGLQQMDPQKLNLLTVHVMESIHETIEPGTGGIRRIPGTVLKNSRNGEIMYTPPQSWQEVRDLMSNLEQYLNLPEMQETDPLIKMAVAHYQFESIHPFTDGNGRTGRILNILYLIHEKELKNPILYLSKYINKNKTEYYQLLNEIHQNPSQIKEFVLYMLRGIEEMSRFTVRFIHKMQDSMRAAEEMLQKEGFTNGKELTEIIFLQFYTRNEYVREKLNISRNTAAKYLKRMVQTGLLTEEKIGKSVLYKNAYLWDLMESWGAEPE